MTTWKARPTTYRGIQMRSRLEAHYAAELDALKERMPSIVWEYEPRAFANRYGQYLPDFRVIDGPIVVYIEVRPTVARAIEALAPMQIIWDSEPAAILTVECPDGIYEGWPGKPWRWTAYS